MEDFLCTPDMRITRSRATRLASRMTRTADIRNSPRICSGNVKERDHLEKLDEDVKIKFNPILRNRMRKGGLDSSDSGYGQVMGCCKDCDGNWGSIKMRSPSCCSRRTQLYGVHGITYYFKVLGL
jgi:hypothetical protein